MSDPLVRVRPERFVAGGAALGHLPDGRVVFVRGGIPGDDVDVEITADKRGFVEARAVAVHTAAPDRVAQPGEQRLAGGGGCDWQHIADRAQLGHKLQIVTDALRRTGHLPGADIRAGASVPAEGYRTTVRVIGDSEGRAAFRLEQSHDTSPAAGCAIADPRLARMLARVHVPPGVEVTLRVSAATGEKSAHWNHKAGQVTGLPENTRTGPNAYITEHVAGVPLRVSAGSFFQSGPAAAELLVDAVSRAAPELAVAVRVVDAYAGVGLFAATVVPARTQVTVIESAKSAAADARVNLKGRPATVVASEVGRWQADGAYDVVIADPARTGLAKPGVGALVAAQAPVFVLVSCDPVALARDAALLAEAGYRHEYTEVLDLFPNTHHVEAVTRFVHTAD